MYRTIALGALLWLSIATGAQAAAVVAMISIGSQKMHVMVDGVERYSWDVSTAREGYRTPLGSYQPIRTERMWYSQKYDNSPMPYSVFFYGGYAVHGTTDLKRLGRPASHGCVRLHPDNAKVLFGLVSQYGMQDSQILVVE